MSGTKQCPRCKRWLAEYEQVCPCGQVVGAGQTANGSGGGKTDPAGTNESKTNSNLNEYMKVLDEQLKQSAEKKKRIDGK